METNTEDDRDRPDEIDQADETSRKEFGTQDDTAQEAEWSEDAKEGGG